MTLHDGLLSVVCELSTRNLPNWNGWHDGPAPFEFRHHESGLIHQSDVTARKSHFRQGAVGELYGDGNTRVRRHRMFGSAEVVGRRVVAVEALINPLLQSPIGIVHFDLTDESPVSICRTVEQLVRGSSEQWNEEMGVLFGTGAGTIAKRIFHVAFVHLDASVDTLVKDVGEISREAQWLRALCTAVDPNDRNSIPFDQEDPQFATGTVFLSGTWRAQVALRGAAFVGWSTNGEDPFLSSQAGTYVKSLYLDAFLVGLLQQGSLQYLADRVYALDIESDSDVLEELQGQVLLFRQNLWWQHISPTEISNRLLLEFQRRHRSEDLFKELATEVNQFSSRLAQRAAERTSAVLGLMTFVGVPAGLVIASAQVAVSDGVGHGAVVVGAAVVFLSLTLLSRNVRNMAKTLYRTGRQ